MKTNYKIKKCENCKNEYAPTSSTQRFCSLICRDISSTFNCVICNKEFKKWDKKSRSTCSDECCKVLLSRNKKKAERITLHCYVCNKEFIKRKSQIKSDYQLCSKKCWSIWMRDERPNMITKQKSTIKQQIQNGRKFFNKGFKKGYFYSKKNDENMHYRSSWEKQFYETLELDESVISYVVEPVKLFYADNDKLRIYIPDILIVYKDKRKELVEIKPKYFTKTRVNKMKFLSAEEYCKFNNMTFRIITEDDLFKS